ncbi:UEV domain-containing protein [Chaetomium fimeti]|uniref:UEV domain-containing protein n=1 Tax=Chaetomium fimeti TaxID=1854472 RepID=A0AAE0LNG3_9PEZI|nr:UEV domain-containing protein [Chaetomium fimeti]
MWRGVHVGSHEEARHSRSRVDRSKTEYHDVNRTYNDVAQALSQYPSLSPRTDVHTFPDGNSALLLHLSGTIPVLFRGATYRFPISIWVPHAYPREPPLAYVTPTETMVVRPGQHVDPQGQVYHPYLVGWSTFWDKSTILDFLAILQDIFAKEPPVVARQQGPPPAARQTHTPPPVPPLPPDLAPRPASGVQSAAPDDTRPPPPPPKPGPQVASQPQPSPIPVQQSGPPVPPPPPKVGGQPSHHAPNGQPMSRQEPPRPGPSRYETAPPLPPQGPQAPLAQRGPLSPPAQNPPPQRPPQYQGPPPAGFPPGPQQAPVPPSDPRHMATFSHPPQYNTPPPTWQQPPPPVQPQPKPKPPPPPDLMDDDLTLAIPSPSAVPAPPIPPNPEKDHLLHQLAQTLYMHRQKARAQNTTSLQGLHAQRAAMQQAMATLQAESAQLTQLTALLTSNTAILQDSLRQADGVIEGSANHPEPDIDELLVAPTVVGNQLYELVAEERALADAIFVLGRAVERGRIVPQTFAKMTRGMAREWYLKKALVKKIGRGMGLAE